MASDDRVSPPTPPLGAGMPVGGDEGLAAGGYTVGTVSREALTLFVVSGLTLAIGFVTSLLVARVLGPFDQGLFAALRTDATMVMTILGLGAPAALYYYASRSSEDRPALLGASLVHAGLLGAAAVGLVLLIGGPLAQAQGAGDDTGLYLLAAILVPAVYLEYCYVFMLRAELRFRLANVVTVAGRVAGLAAAIVLVAVLDMGVEGAIIATATVSLIQVAIALPVLLRRGMGLSPRLARQTLSYGLRAQLGVLFRFASLRFDLLLLTFFASPRIVGYYAVAQVIAELVLLVPQAFGWVLSPLVARSGRDELTRRLLRLNGTLTLAATAALAFVGPALVVLAYGHDYRPAVVPFLILLPGVWLLACGELVSWVLSARGRPGVASWLAAYQGLATVVLDFALIPPLGLVGAAVASAVAYASFGVLSLVLLGRHDDVPPTRLALTTGSELRGYAAALRRRASLSWAR